MKADTYLFDGSKACKLDKLPTDSKQDKVNKEKILAKTEKNLQEMALLQDAFYADGREGLVVVLQALDAAGKDSTVKHVMSGLNPQGVTVHSFKQPSSEELAHDYLWRVNSNLPRRGEIAIFNRSYYEDVLVVQVHDMQGGYKMADRVIKESKKDFFSKRYRQIRNYEEYLYENSYRVVKIFLHVSKDAQKKRFLERIDAPSKNWKFSSSDLKERALWDNYMATFEEVISETSTAHSPWYAIPADQKWYTRYLVSEIVLNELKSCSHAYPALPDAAKADLAQCRTQLVNEDGKITEDELTPAEKAAIKKEISKAEAEASDKKATAKPAGKKRGRPAKKAAAPAVATAPTAKKRGRPAKKAAAPAVATAPTAKKRGRPAKKA